MGLKLGCLFRGLLVVCVLHPHFTSRVGLFSLFRPSHQDVVYLDDSSTRACDLGSANTSSQDPHQSDDQKVQACKNLHW